MAEVQEHCKQILKLLSLATKRKFVEDGGLYKSKAVLRRDGSTGPVNNSPTRVDLDSSPLNA